MNIPHRWFLTFEGSDRERNYPFHTKVADLHLDGTRRRIECRVHVQSKSAQNLRCSEHYMSNVTSLKHTFSGTCAFLKSQTTTAELSPLGNVTSLSLFGCEGCGTGAQRTQLTLSGYATPLIPSLPPPPMMPTWPTPPYTKATTSHLLRRSQMTVYPVLLDDVKTCWTRQFHDMDMIDSTKVTTGT